MCVPEQRTALLGAVKGGAGGTVFGFWVIQSFRVTLRPSETAKFFHIWGDNNLAQLWNLLEIGLGALYSAAVAYPGFKRTIRVHRTMDPLAFLNSHGFHESR